MPPNRLAAVLAAGRRRAVATGAPPGPAQREVMGNADLMTAILTSAMDPVHVGQACRLAARWCASHRGACDDDARWGQLREVVFPNTAGQGPPYPEHIKSNRQWFRMLCQGLEKAMYDFDREQKQKEERLARAPRVSMFRIDNDAFATRRYNIAKLKLQVILWDRWRKDVRYLKPNPLFFAKLADQYWVALTEEEMRAQLDALEERDDSASGALGGD